MAKKNILFSHNMQTIYAVLFGIIAGFFGIQPLIEAAEIIAQITVKLMKLVALPLLFLSIVSAAAHFKNFGDIKVVGLRIIKYTLLTTFIAALLAEMLFYFGSPWMLSQSLSIPANKIENGASFFDTVFAMIPDNFLGAFIDNNVLAVVLMAIILALALLSLKAEEKDLVFAFFSGLLNAVMKIVHYGLKFIPIAVFAFVTMLFVQISSDQDNTLSAIWGLTVTVISANILQAVVVLPFLLWLNGINPWKLFMAVKEALILAFFTRSSAASLPVTLDHAIKDAGIDKDVARLSLPLCTTINMNGCAQFILLTVYFVAAHTGNALSFSEHIAMIFIAVLAAIGNAGVPMGCFFLASSILASKEIPIYLMGSILPLYTFIDMIETSLNVWSDVTVTKIVDIQGQRATHRSIK